MDDDHSLRQMADRIQARVVRRMGETFKTVSPGARPAAGWLYAGLACGCRLLNWPLSTHGATNKTTRLRGPKPSARWCGRRCASCSGRNMSNDDGAAFKEVRRQIMLATLDLESKALNYLLVANGAGLAGCLTVLKDYANVPQVHGVGILIVVFAVGLVLGTLSFLLFQSAHFEIMHRVLVEEKIPLRAIFYMGFCSVFMKLSGLCFLVAIVIIAVKLARL